MPAAKRKAPAKGPARAPVKKPASKPAARPAQKAKPSPRPVAKKLVPAKAKATPKAAAKAAPKPVKQAPKPTPKPATKAAPKPAPAKAAPLKATTKTPAKASTSAAPAPKPAPAPAPVAEKPAPAPKPAPTPKAAPAPKTAPAAKAAPPAPPERIAPPVTDVPALKAMDGTTREADLQSALVFGIFAAINRTFGAYGKSLLKHASERFLEYEQKRGHLPPTAADPLRGLEAFFDRLIAQGYARRATFTESGPTVVCVVEGIPEWDAMEALRQLSYPLLPVFPGDIISTFLTRYYGESVAVESTELVPEKRGIQVKFTHRARQEDTAAQIPEVTRVEYYD